MTLPSHLASAAQTVLWQPNPGPQTLLIECPCDEVFYGGARGGGKTEASIGDWLIHQAIYGENAAGIFVRRKLSQLAQVITRTQKLFRKIGATYNVQQKEWTMANGARLRFVYLERDADAENYQGHEYTRVYIEEATNFPSPGPIMKLKATLRSSVGVPCGMRLTGNPGGPGHQWVKARYIDLGPYTVTTEEEDVELPDGTLVRVTSSRTFIPAKLKDNPKLLENDPGYVLKLRQTGSAALVNAWLEGLWDQIEGAFFSEWDPDRHILRGELYLPSHWARFRAMDWGSAKPFSVGWYAVADGSTEFRRHAIIKYREWYGVQTRLEKGREVVVPNEGLKLTAQQVAWGILQREQGDRVHYGVADPSIFAQNGGPSIAETMMVERCAWIRADNARQAGWEYLHNLLAPADRGQPLLLVHEDCRHTIRTLPLMQHDEDNPEDLDTDAEDHAVDETRYAAMSRQGVIDLPQPYTWSPPKTVERLTINELLARQREKQYAATHPY